MRDLLKLLLFVAVYVLGILLFMDVAQSMHEGGMPKAVVALTRVREAVLGPAPAIPDSERFWGDVVVDRLRGCAGLQGADHDSCSALAFEYGHYLRDKQSKADTATTEVVP